MAARARTTVRQLERRVERLEEEISALRGSDEAKLERARRLIIEHLRREEEIEPMDFAVEHELPADIVEQVLQEFDRKKWTVPVDD